MVERFSHKILPVNEKFTQVCYTTIISECVEDFTFREAERIAEKFNVDFEVVVAIIMEWKCAEEFLNSEYKGSA